MCFLGKSCYNKYRLCILGMIRNKKQAGFTLIELLVVIAIISLLAVGIFLAFTSARVRSRDARRVADIKQMSSALESYYSQCNSYPVVLTPLTLDSTKSLATGSDPNCGDNAGSGNNGGFGGTTGNVITASLGNVPIPPDGTCQTAGPGGTDANPYIYTSYQDTDMTTLSASGDVNATGFKITFCTATSTAGYGPGAHVLTASGVQ